MDSKKITEILDFAQNMVKLVLVVRVRYSKMALASQVSSEVAGEVFGAILWTLYRTKYHALELA